MDEPVWVDRLVIDAVHLDQIRKHRGLPGVRGENALESALARARNKWTYDASSDSATLATMLAVAAGRCREPELAEWLRQHIVPSPL